MEVLHINHSSIVVESLGGTRILVDPWLISPAFGSWIPDPHTTADLGSSLIATSDFHATAISHAHDDHLDEFFIRHHQNNRPILVPDIRSGSLSRRLKGLTESDVVLVGESGVQIGDLKIQAIGNPNFTTDDSLLIFSDSTGVVIHANDNWRIYDELLLSKISLAIADVDRNNIWFLVQFGIADAFPWFYPNISDRVCDELIAERFGDYGKNISKNLELLGLTNCYTYANQSRYDELPFRAGLSIKSIRESFLEKYKFVFSQLSPNSRIVSGLGLVGPPSSTEKTKSFFEHLLSKLAAHASGYVHDKIGGDYELVFALSGQEIPEIEGSSSMVVFSATARVWSEILTGKQTIEAITIGGSGLVYRSLSRNISDLQKTLTPWGYSTQARLSTEGWSWLCESPI